VLLGIHLERRGLSRLLIGIVLTVGLLAAALTSLAAAGLSGRLGRRRTLALTGVLMMLSGILLVVAAQPWQLILGGATGMLGAASSDDGPFLAIEQAALDVPARQAYLASIVRPAEREGAIALVGATRTFSQVLAPTIAGAAIQVAAYGVPFFATASLKLVFLGVLYAGWRGRPAEHEVAR
jgi:MFS family permease